MTDRASISGSAPTPFRDNALGALIMMASMASFTLNDAFMKSLAGDWPLFQALFIRSLASTVILFGIAGWRGFGWARFRGADWRLVALRTASEVGAAFFFISALFHMPIANITAIIQVLPLTVTLAGALVLGEHVGWRRLAAIALGGVGMALIVRPGPEGFDIYAVYGLMAVLCVTVRDLAARRLGRAVPTLTVAFLTALSITVFSGVGAAFTDWAPVTPASLGKVSGAVVLIIGGYVFSIQVMRQGDIAFVSPFRYSSLLWALALGWFVFGDWPDWITLLGAATIVATGVFTFYRERRLAAGSHR